MPFFDEFKTKFKGEEPIIDLLHQNCEKPLKTMDRLMKSEVILKSERHLKK